MREAGAVEGAVEGAVGDAVEDAVGAPGDGPRLLVVDNHDSFTFNLVELLHEVTGVRPRVVANDDPGFSLADLDAHDGVVLSPGPGSPHVPTDLGHCSAVLAAARVPVLGVCLGHQAIAAAAGGTVGPAREPVHGRVWPVHHRGDGLFAGLPGPLEAVRYHSLVVTDPGPDLVVDAWTADGEVMALHHRERPWYGVQFHPESVSSRAGRELLRAFTARCGAGSRTSVTAVRAVDTLPRSTSRDVVAGPAARRTVRPAPGWTPALAHELLFSGAAVAACLAGDAEGFGRSGRSVSVAVAGDAGWWARADDAVPRVDVERAGSVVSEHLTAVEWLERTCARLPEVPGHPGLVGFLGYEAACADLDPPAEFAATPDAVWVFGDRVVQFDHGSGEVELLALGDGAEEFTAAAAELLSAPPPPALPGHGVRVIGAGPRARHGRAEYLDLVGACHDLIRRGESYELCLTTALSADVEGFAAERVLRALVAERPVPSAGVVRCPGTSLVSLSPEGFLDVVPDPATGTRTARSRPMKGTRPRGADPAEDARLRAELAASEKDRAENLMVVDLVRHDLAHVAVPGSVRVEELFGVHAFPASHQMTSTVAAELPAGVPTVRCVRALLPGGSMTGAPKLRTVQLLRRLEGAPRGIYSGVLGVLGADGSAVLGMVIRSFVHHGGLLTYGVGGAVTQLSDAADEHAEVLVKARPFLDVVGPLPPREDRAARGR
ncbi:chorismate-binding protein [Kineococcus sp. SYSU DK004]|uniref:chorismate-binding protein n=1 Tax=Kineococcus sp. SYSU DK004 TaxID=3383125 RepID=UPI003D7E83C3